jgi:beta-glucosidase
MKHNTQQNKKGKNLVIAVILAIFALLVTVGMHIFSAHMDLYLGRGKAIVSQAKGTENWEKIYYHKDYDSKESLQRAANKLVEQIEAEGIVLLKNNGTLPLIPHSSRSLRITLLGRSAADPVYGGSGSGSVDLSSVVDLKTALINRGFEINETVYKELAEFASYTTRLSNTGATVRVYKNPRANIVMDRPGSSTYYIGEMPVHSYTDSAIASFKNFQDAAIVVIGRGGGEGGDLSQDIKGFDDNYVKGQHQLELNKDEKDLLSLAKKHFNRIIVLINSSSAMELGDLEKDPDIDSIVWIGSPGQTGFFAVADVLKGTVNPSGRTADIYPVDFRKDPTFVNFGNFKYRNIHRGNALGDAFFVHYEEGIYYGYRYYETAAHEGFISYDDAVVYPFGYGLSYTTFQWELLSQDLEGPDGKLRFSVRVINTGKVAGKEVVQLYYSPPYTKGGIEKSSIVLADFAKTKLLNPGESDVVTLSVAVEDMASYDYKKNRAYVLEKGAYVLKFQTDSHRPKQGMPEITYMVDKTIVYAGANHRSSDKTVVTNQFDDVSALFVDEPVPGRGQDGAGFRHPPAVSL